MKLEGTFKRIIHEYSIDIRSTFPNYQYGYLWIRDSWNDHKNKWNKRIYSVMGFNNKLKRGHDPMIDTMLDGVDKLIPLP